MTRRVIVLDYAWPDLAIERATLEAAGLELVDASGLDRAELLEAARDASALMTCWAPVDAELIAACGPELRVIARFGVGLDNIDLATAAERGAVVVNVPDYCVEEVSDHVLALVLCWSRGVAALNRAVHDGTWSPAGARLRRLSSMTVGVWGTGRIGRRTAEKFAALGVRVLAHNRDGSAGGAPGIEWVPLETLLASSDVVSLHIPAVAGAPPVVDADLLARMRPGSFLVNTSRGALVDTQALARSVAEGHLAGAALDVVDGEPRIPAELVPLDRILLTPHVAFSSDVSVAELRTRACEDVVRVLSGRAPRDPVPV